MLATSAIGRWGGFTLIELLVVLAILALMLAAFPLALNRMMPSRRIASAEQQLVAKLRDFESQSAATGEPVRATLQELASVVVRGTHVKLVDPDGGILASVVLFPDGSATPARIELTDGRFQSAVLLSGLTGRVYVDAAL